MNIKLVFGFILGVSSLGGAVAGGYYLIKPESSSKTKNNKNSSKSQDESLKNSKVAKPETNTLSPAASAPREQGVSGSSSANNSLSQRSTSSDSEDVQRAVET